MHEHEHKRLTSQNVEERETRREQTIYATRQNKPYIDKAFIQNG